jgi:hypothetical protein
MAPAPGGPDRAALLASGPKNQMPETMPMPVENRKPVVLAPGEGRPYEMGRSALPAGELNFSAPGNFKPHMPAIADWFHAHPPGAAGE